MLECASALLFTEDGFEKILGELTAVDDTMYTCAYIPFTMDNIPDIPIHTIGSLDPFLTWIREWIQQRSKIWDATEGNHAQYRMIQNLVIRYSLYAAESPITRMNKVVRITEEIAIRVLALRAGFDAVHTRDRLVFNSLGEYQQSFSLQKLGQRTSTRPEIVFGLQKPPYMHRHTPVLTMSDHVIPMLIQSLFRADEYERFIASSGDNPLQSGVRRSFFQARLALKGYR